MLKTLDKLANGEHAFIVCIGDSITEQNYHLQGNLNYVGQFTERLMELYGRRSRMLNSGTSGDTTRGILGRLDRDALRFKPDLVTVMIGMNDAVSGIEHIVEFKQNLELIISRVTEAGSELLLLTQNMLNYNVNEGAVNSRKSYPAFVKALREVASATRTPLCDICQKWEEYVGGSTNDHLILMNDSIHPGVQGHALMSSVLFEYLGISPSEAEKADLNTQKFF
jgi:acyl-CoA thioesterase-1